MIEVGAFMRGALVFRQCAGEVYWRAVALGLSEETPWTPLERLLSCFGYEARRLDRLLSQRR